MKKVYATMMLMACAYTLHAQPTRLISVYHATHNSTSFVPQDTVKITYDATNMQIGGAEEFEAEELPADEIHSVKYDAPSFVDSYKVLKEYDANNNLIKLIEQNTKSSPALRNDYQYVYSYNANGDLKHNSYLRWQPATATWDTLERSNYTYDANNNLTQIYVEQKDMGSWRPLQLYEYVYDAANRQTEAVYAYWSLSFGAFLYQNKTLTHYNAANGIDTLTTQLYNIFNYVWNDYERTIFIYGPQVETQIEQKVQSNFAWRNVSETVIHYNAGNEIIYRDRSLWDNGSSMFVPDTRDTIVVVGVTPKKVNEIQKKWNGTAFVNDTRTSRTYNANDQWTEVVETSWNATSGTWGYVQGSDSNVYRYQTLTGVNDVATAVADITLAPNPANTYIKVNVSMQQRAGYYVAIYDIAGRPVMQQRIAAGTTEVTLPVAQLAQGNYILSVKTVEGSVSKQFIIK